MNFLYFKSNLLRNSVFPARLCNGWDDRRSYLNCNWYNLKNYLPKWLLIPYEQCASPCIAPVQFSFGYLPKKNAQSMFNQFQMTWQFIGIEKQSSDYLKWLRNAASRSKHSEGAQNLLFQLFLPSKRFQDDVHTYSANRKISQPSKCFS